MEIWMHIWAKFLSNKPSYCYAILSTANQRIRLSLVIRTRMGSSLSETFYVTRSIFETHDLFFQRDQILKLVLAMRISLGGMFESVTAAAGRKLTGVFEVLLSHLEASRSSWAQDLRKMRHWGPSKNSLSGWDWTSQILRCLHNKEKKKTMEKSGFSYDDCGVEGYILPVDPYKWSSTSCSIQWEEEGKNLNRIRVPEGERKILLTGIWRNAFNEYFNTLVHSNF